jgi:hypothetical protein
MPLKWTGRVCVGFAARMPLTGDEPDPGTGFAG